MVRTNSSLAIIVRPDICGPDNLWPMWSVCGPLFKIIEITYFMVSTYIVVLRQQSMIKLYTLFVVILNFIHCSATYRIVEISYFGGSIPF